jgi:hypothetical protein
MKTCTKCGENKPKTEFPKDSSRKDGYQSRCKACKSLEQKEARKQDPERFKTHDRNKYENNREEILKREKERYWADGHERTRHPRTKTPKIVKEPSNETPKERKARYYQENKEAKKEASRKYYAENREKALATCKVYRENNKEAKAERDRKYRENNREKVLAKQKEFRENNPEKVAAQKKASYEKNKPHYVQQNYNSKKKRLASDPMFKFKEHIRRVVREGLRRRGVQKSKITEEILGCNYATLHHHLEITYIENYACLPDWENDDLHIDHIRPISSANTEDEVYELNHFTNLQLLLSTDNLTKSNRTTWSI